MTQRANDQKGLYRKLFNPSEHGSNCLQTQKLTSGALLEAGNRIFQKALQFHPHALDKGPTGLQNVPKNTQNLQGGPSKYIPKTRVFLQLFFVFN